MKSLKEKSVLISGASFAGLSTAYWMNKAGYQVTVVEIARGLKKGGTPVNIEGNTIGIVKRMGLPDQIRSNNIVTEVMEFINADGVRARQMPLQKEDDQPAKEEYQIERNSLLTILFEAVKDDVDIIFGDSIASLKEEKDYVDVTFKGGTQRSFDLLFGCDGVHSAVRKLAFGEEAAFVHFLGAYFSITIVDKLLIRENILQLYNEPGKAIMLNTYNNKTDIVLCFSSETEIPYDYRNEDQQRTIILDQFATVGWRGSELLDEVRKSKTFYFDKLCQVTMPSWTKGRVALVGDAGYCASPAAGKGGSLAIDGAAALADAFEKYPGNFELAFREYNDSFRPYIEEVQAHVVRSGVDFLLPRTEEAIRERNTQTGSI